MDLRDLWRPGRKLTWRRLGVLIRALPVESATKTALRNDMPSGDLESARESADPSKAQWSQMEMLMAALSDAVRRLEYSTIRVQGGKIKPPDPSPRPGVEPKGKSRKQPKTARQRQDIADAVLARINGQPIEGRWIALPPGKAARQKPDTS